MSLAIIDALQSQIIPRLPKVSKALVKQYTDLAASEFFERVPIWQGDVVITGVVGQNLYDIDTSLLGDNLLVHDLLLLLDEDEEEVDTNNYSWDNFQLYLADALLPEAGDDAITWTARIHVTGTSNCVKFPSDLVLRFDYAIVGRAIELLANMQGMPWGNPYTANSGGKSYRRGLQHAMMAVGPNEVTG